jgi:hypothetical protein
LLRTAAPPACAFAAVAVTHLASLPLKPQPRLLNAAEAGSWSHLANTGAAGVGCLLCARAATVGGERLRAWWVAAGVFAVLFADGVTRAHDGFALWPLLFVPLLVGLALAALRVSAGRPERRGVMVALCLLAASLCAHVVGHAVLKVGGWGSDSVPYQVKVVLKEGFETAGWTALLLALRSIRVHSAAERAASRVMTAAHPATSAPPGAGRAPAR